MLIVHRALKGEQEIVKHFLDVLLAQLAMRDILCQSRERALAFHHVILVKEQQGVSFV